MRIMEKIISKSLITAIPGIGIKYAKRLDAAGIKKPRDLLKQYEKLDKDPHRFVRWMKTQCDANAGHARKTFDIVKTFNVDEKNQPRKKDDPLKSTSLLMLPMPKKPIAAPVANQKPPSTKPKNLSMQIATDSIQTDSEKLKKVIVPGIQPLHPPNMMIDYGNKDGKDALNQRLFKLKDQFKSVHDTANKKMVELQSELGRMQHVSQEFNVLAEIFSSSEKLSTFEQSLDRLQNTVRLTEEKVHEINTNNYKVRRMIRDINEAAKKQHESNEVAIAAVGERLNRWEIKMDRVARKISNHKFDLGDLKSNDAAYEQLKSDIDSMLNGRLNVLAADLEMMKDATLAVIFLTFLVLSKTFLFDSFRKVKTAVKN